MPETMIWHKKTSPASKDISDTPESKPVKIIKRLDVRDLRGAENQYDDQSLSNINKWKVFDFLVVSAYFKDPGCIAGQTMKTNSKSRCLRLSPNELQELVKQEKEKWRVFRIQQVREQAKEEARRVREAVRTQERRMLDDLRQEVEVQWQDEKEKRVIQLEKEYQDCMKNIGHAHRQAREQPNPNEVLQQQAEHNQRMAVLRGREADKQQREEARQQQHQRNRLLKQRQDVLHLEKLRAKHVADLPVPKTFRKKIVKEKKPPSRVAFHEAGTFTTTHYVPQNVRIEKEVWSSKPSAKEKAAVEEAERARQEETLQRQAKEERERREQRGREALKREHLTRLLQHLTAGLDEAQRQHHLSHFLHGKSGPIWESGESQLKEQTYQQRQMEEAVEKLLQKEEDEKKDREKEYLETAIIPEPSVQSSDYLEEIESSEDVAWETTSKTKVRGLQSLLKEVERRRNHILQELEDSIPERGPSGDGDGGRPKDHDGDIHLADTVPVHLHPGHPPTRSLPKSRVPGLLPPPQPEGSPMEAQPDTSEAPDSSSTVLPLSEESIPVSNDSTQHSTSPSIPHRFNTPQDQQTKPKDTHARHPSFSDFHTTTSDASSLNSEDIKINIDLDVGSSSSSNHVVSDSTLEQPQRQQTEPYVSSTEYYSLPSDIPEVSLQEIEDNLRRIQQHKQRNQDLIVSLARKRGLPDHQVPTTYLEKLKEDGSGKKLLTRKGKYELQKKELIRFYIQKLLQRGDQEEELSASTVEGSGLSISSLGSFLGCLERGRQENQPAVSTSVTSASSLSMSLSPYEDIDEFPVRMRPRDMHLPPYTSSSSSCTSTSSINSSICLSPYFTHTDTPYTSTAITTTTTYPYYHITTTTTTSSSMSSSLTSHHPLIYPNPSSSSITYPLHHISELPPDSHGSTSTSTSLKHEQSGGDSVSITSGGAPAARSPQDMSDGDEGNQKYITPPHSYLTPPREDESSLEDSKIATESTTTRHADPFERLRWHTIQRQRAKMQHHTDSTTSSEDSPRGTTTKLSEVSRKKLSGFKFTETIPSFVTQTSITSSDSPRGTVSKLSKPSWTKISDVRSSEADRSSNPPVTSTTTSTITTQTVSYSSGESTVSMPDMAEVLRRFGLGEAKSKSSSATPSNEKDDDDEKEED